jgi:hypothetical protein
VDDLVKMHIFLEPSFSLMLDQILHNLNHFQNLYQLLHQTERQLVALHLHVFYLKFFLFCFGAF